MLPSLCAVSLWSLSPVPGQHRLCKHLAIAVWEMLLSLGLSCAYLGDSDRAETRLATVGEVTDDLDGV